LERERGGEGERERESKRVKARFTSAYIII
jgi:hypothetical protein